MSEDSTARDEQVPPAEAIPGTDPATGRASDDDSRPQRPLVIGGVLVVLVALVAAGIWWQGSRSSEDTATDPVDGSTGEPVAEGMSFGTSDGAIVDVYVDYQCSHCADLEQVIGPELISLVSDGDAVLVLRPVTFQSRASGRGAAALYCAAETGQALAMHQELLTDITADFSPEGLTATAGSMGLDAEAFGACLGDQATRSWVNGVTDTARSDGISAIPAVFVDGTRLTEAQLGSGPAFRDAVLAGSADG